MKIKDQYGDELEVSQRTNQRGVAIYMPFAADGAASPEWCADRDGLRLLIESLQKVEASLENT